ncbi:RNA polymerase II-associated protein 3 isoform X1 [Amyelois transitella]|uniref:RNA polymerase II-associated protein 3 isoform X1 n=3 Tax=Amyelois transitella TaxID=680683 RepID=UPI0029905992|nr:RNA polymerase II-associated protein 3 isoform X1 [Amyelois transitella]
MDKAFEIQKNVRDNAKTLQTYLTDLQNWEIEMKRKEAALNGEFEQDLPPVRSKIKKEKPPVVKKVPEKRIPSHDYKSWEKFDVDKACEEVDMEDIGPVSLDSKKSKDAKLEKLREEAQHEKERGNAYVKQEKWDEAISCYTRAIELVKDDAIYYANRGLCYLKKDSLHQAETDCTEALRLDPTYVKALQRRATARERLGSLRSASHDLIEVLKLEPKNNAAKKQLDTIKARMGTKGAKSKSSPSTTPIIENKSIMKPHGQVKITELPDQPKVEEVVPKVISPDEKWRNGDGEPITVIKPVKKPPHLRSKRMLKPVQIKEIPLGKVSAENEKASTRMKIIEIEDDKAHGDSNNNDSGKNVGPLYNGDKGKGDGKLASPESAKLIAETIFNEKESLDKMVPPVNSVQFMTGWKCLKGHDSAKSHYLSIIEPSKIPSIFENALESDILSDLLRVLTNYTEKYKEKTVKEYLKNICRVKRFSALAMFLSNNDREHIEKLLHHCVVNEAATDEEIADLKNKYEL